jgi:hypothetical protein
MRRVLDWMIGFIAPSTLIHFGTTGKYSAIADLHTLQFTVAHTPGFSVFTSSILETDLLHPQCNFTSHMESSFASLIPFLPFLLDHLRLPSPEPDPILDYN